MEEKRELIIEKLWIEFDKIIELRSKRYSVFKESNFKNVHARIDAENLTSDLNKLIEVINKVKQGMVE